MVNPTMAEMADELGLSRMSVSCVVNGRARQIGLSEETIQRVRNHLDRRGYVPSRVACRLREKPGRVVGILHIGSLNSHLVEAFHRFAESFSNVSQGLEIMVTPREQLEPALRELLARRVTDLVWLHNPSAGEAYLEERIANYLKRMRTIIYNYFFGAGAGETELLERGVALVGVDRQLHYRQMARFLKKLGHQVIALPYVDPFFHVDSFTKSGLVVADCPPPFRVDTLINAMRRQGVTAAVFNGDVLACQAMDALCVRGVRIPEDLTVMGFDGMSRMYRQDLTTLVMPVTEMVAKVGEIISGSEQGARHCFDMELVKGNTHGPPLRS